MTYIKTNSLGVPPGPSYEVDSNWFTNIPYVIEDGNLKATGSGGGGAATNALRLATNAVPSEYAGSIYNNIEMQLYIDKYYSSGSDSWTKVQFWYFYKITDNLIAKISKTGKTVTCTVTKNGTETTVGTIASVTENTSYLINYSSDGINRPGTILFGAYEDGSTLGEHEYIVEYDETLAADKVTQPGFTESRLTASSWMCWPIFNGSLTKVKIVDTRKDSGYLETSLIKIKE
jgi:hypothetical protein